MKQNIRDADPAELLELAVNLARRAGELARRTRAEAIGDVATKSTATDVVTAADQAAERLVVSALAELRPGDAVLGEETGASEGGSGVRWVLDPIDGTVNYLYGLPGYAVSLAAEIGGQVVAGVVHNPVTGEEWTAVRGRGAMRNWEPIRCSEVTELGMTLLATGFGYAADRRAHQARVVAEVLPLVRDIRRYGAAALDLCYAAEGRVDAYYEKGLNAWDHAAGGLIAAEAGLVVSGLRGAPPGPSMVIAAPAAIFDALHALLVELDADGGP
ncbi:inositol monophosphatase family protein [Longispora albida]|uniref:inositol monophosphatase family protein n=1 Tax=Longispora albida TaxID=203523 RepID=UPI0003637E4A|nr:inositol monophosphatase family protein [Longispora albida]